MFIKLRQHFKKHIKHAARRVRAFSSKLRKYFKEHIDEILIRVVFLLGALAVAVMLSDGITHCLQELLGLNEKGKYEVLKAIGFCIVGVLLVLQALAANKRAKAMEDTAKQQAKATENTEAGQRQERLKNAIEHLGHGSYSVRMGGAYELFHLAEDTEKLRQTVMNILCAHIRQTTTGQTTRGKDYQAEHKTKPSEEIQGLLTLLFIEEHDVFEDCSINLQGSYLNGATLVQARLKKANLMETQLQGANLFRARLQGAVLMVAQMQGAIISEAQLQEEADLRYAKLQGANLFKARLQGADLSDAHMQGAFLSKARLQGADLSCAQLQGAVLEKTRLQGATLWGARLQGAVLWQAQLQEADLMAAQLRGVSSQDQNPPGFERKISDRIGKPSDLTGIIFAGGLQEEDLDTLCKGLSAKKAQVLQEKLRSHVGQPASNELPENSGAATAPPSLPYTQEEAEQWIAECQAAMREVPKRDDS